jgi:hypothetical protein
MISGCTESGVFVFERGGKLETRELYSQIEVRERIPHGE